jgi:hypothetical protein
MSAETKRTTEHETIRDWAEERAGVPAAGSDGALRIDFPDGAGADQLEHISWEEWFSKFDEDGLCFLYQEEKVSGEESTFFKLINRDET